LKLNTLIETRKDDAGRIWQIDETFDTRGKIPPEA